MNNKAVNNIIITGATRGLGLSHAQYLANRGYNIALVDISKDACSIYGEAKNISMILEKLRKSNKSEFYSCDLTNYKNTKDTFQKILNDFGSIEGAIFNAGGDIKGRDRNASGGKAQNNSICIDIDDHDAIFDRNYRTCLNSIKAIVPILREQRFGKIITTSSASAGYGVTKETAYSTSKAAIIHLTRSVAAELREYDICVNCVAPGPTLTGRFKETISERTEKDLEKFTGGTSFLTKVADSIQISYLVEFLLSSKADYISGQVIRIDGGQFTSPI